VNPGDTLGILIDADQDSMTSSLTLRRLRRQRSQEVLIYHINFIERADNLAFIKPLNIKQKHIGYMNRSRITTWAIVEFQPRHRNDFMNYQFDIIIDHHPVAPPSKARAARSHRLLALAGSAMAQVGQ